MKGTATLLQDQEIEVVELSSPAHGPVALVNIDILRNLLQEHAKVMSLRDLRINIVKKIENCITTEEYKQVLSYDLAMISLHDALREHDEKAWKEKEAKLGRQAPPEIRGPE